MPDANRSTFVQRPYRYETAEDLAIKATYPTARELVFDTNLGSAAASALATAIFDESSDPASAFKIEVEGIYHLEDIAGGPLAFVLSLPMYETDGRTYKVTKFDTDYLRNRTLLEVRG